MAYRRVRIPRRSLVEVAPMRLPRRKRRQVKMGIRRSVFNPMPTFTETFALARDNLVIPAGSSLGKVFKIAFSDIPQHPQYMNLYTQYKINWVKVMLIPSYNTQSADINGMATLAGTVGMARIVYSIQNSPNEVTPTTEAEVLSDNGAKIRSIGTKWSCSFKPVPDVALTVLNSTGVIPVKVRKSQWFNYDDTTVANNPDHGAVTAFISVPGLPGTEEKAMQYTCYYKVNFSLRDPK